MAEDSQRQMHPSRSSGSKRSRVIPIIRPAKVEDDVFISLEKTTENLRSLLRRQSRTHDAWFFRAPVASGKSTLVAYLANQYPDEFVIIQTAYTRDTWFQNVVNKSGLDNPKSSHRISEALGKMAKEKKIIVIDEAHSLFRCPEVTSTFFKQNHLRTPPLKFLLFSASGSTSTAGVGEAGKIVEIETPREIPKYQWYPPSPNAQELQVQLAEADPPVCLDDESVRFFINLCGSHRGILMRALRWVQEEQEKELNQDNKAWDLRKTISHVRSSIEEDMRQEGSHWSTGFRKELAESRAVVVDGRFSDLENIPREFGMVLFGGPKDKSQLNGQVRTLTINGFIFPQRSGPVEEEFVEFNWNMPQLKYEISNPLISQYYMDVLSPNTFQRKWKEGLKSPESAAGLVARVLPFMSLMNVVGVPIRRDDGKLSDSLSRHGLPYEDDYNFAMGSILRDNLNYTVSTPLDGDLGKTDLIVTHGDANHYRTGIESIMAWRDNATHVEHAMRFSNEKKINYSGCNQKALVIFGSKQEQVKDRMEYVMKNVNYVSMKLEIIGLFVSINHNFYEMYQEEGGNVVGPIHFACDNVSRYIKTSVSGEKRSASAQECRFVEDERNPKRPRHH
mmetsp:Transcript_49627/g.120356  ORF Transcript_49627/g.120356 Transcript_49627/m.120356 type:complete len:618 (-) Transcript_49627:98-1951(-)